MSRSPQGTAPGPLVSDPLRDAHPEKHVQKPVATTKSICQSRACWPPRVSREAGLCGSQASNGNFPPSGTRNVFLTFGEMCVLCGRAHTHTHTGVHTHTHPAQMQPHTPTTPLPSRMFSCSPTPQLPLTEGSVLRHSGLCSLTCGTALLGLLATLGAPFTARPGQQSAR